MLSSSGPLGLKLIGMAIFIISSLALLKYHTGPVRSPTWAWELHPSTSIKKTTTTTATATATATSTATVITPPPHPSKAHLPATAASASFPKKIWYKLGPFGQSADSKQWTDTCSQKNPSYRVEYLTDASALAYVKSAFSSRPDIVAAYSALKVPILQADLLRYLLLYAEGGLWSDLDVSCEDIQIQDWIPKGFKEKDINLVAGVEFDAGFDYDFERQFATWSVLAKPRSPHLLMVVEDILASLAATTKEHKVPISGVTMEMIDDVVYYTGPRRFSQSVAKSLQLRLGKTVNTRNYSLVMEPKMLGDVLVLPGYALAGSVNTYKEGEAGQALVTHHYAGTWKNKDGGEGGRALDAQAK